MKYRESVVNSIERVTDNAKDRGWSVHIADPARSGQKMCPVKGGTRTRHVWAANCRECLVLFIGRTLNVLLKGEPKERSATRIDALMDDLMKRRSELK